MRKRIYTDNAYRDISTWLTNRGYDYTETKLDSDSAEFEVLLGSYHITMSFNAQKQLFCFTMLNGKVKSSQSFKTFTENFDMYYHIHIEMIPMAKKVADSFEKDVNIRTVFDNFVGSINQGYTVKFKELGSDSRGFRVTESSPVVYHISYVEYNDDEGSYDVLEEADYDVSGKKCVRIKEPFSLQKLDDGDCAIYDHETGQLNYDNGNVSLVLKQDGEDDLILVEGNKGIMSTKGVKVKSRNMKGILKEVLGQKIWEHIPLYNEIKSYLTADDKLVVGGVEYPLRSIRNMLVVNDGKRDIDIRSVDDFEVFIQAHQPTEGVSSIMETSDFDGAEVAEGTEAPVEEAQTAPEKDENANTGESDAVSEDEETPESHDLQQSDAEDIDDDSDDESASTVKLLYKKDELFAVRFINSEGIFDVSPELIKKAGLDIDRIQGVSKLFIKNGIVISDDERKLKKFSHNVTDEGEVLKLIESLFM